MVTSKHTTQMQRAYVLRVRPFKDKQHLVTLLTEYDGCFTAVARVASGKRHQTSRAALRLFQPLLITWQGKHDLKRLTHFETCSADIPLETEGTLMGFYLNELCLRLIPQHLAIHGLLDSYHHTLLSLAQKANPTALRYFELMMLQELGSLPSLTQDHQHNSIQKDQRYHFINLKGWCLSASGHSGAFSGALLWQLETRSVTAEMSKEAQRLTQLFLSQLLGAKPLASRTLYQSYKRNTL